MISPPLSPDALPALIAPVPGPLSRAWLERLRAVESPNITSISSDFPIVWQEASGAAVLDVDGNTYLDATSSFGVALIGHGHPAVRQAIAAQSDLLVHSMGDVHPARVRIELLEQLTQIAPGELGRAVLCTGGAEAVEVALKSALLYTGKPGVVAFSGAYHGLGHGALDVTSRRDFRAPFFAQLARNTHWVPFPDPRWPPQGIQPNDILRYCLGRVEELLVHPAIGGVPFGAVLVEPIQGRGGSIAPPEGFLRGLRDLCDRHRIALIFDEIFTGCGRTGRWFACDHEAVVPDLLCVGKALGGGLPIAACLGLPAVMRAWGQSQGEALHTSTFLGNPVCCAAALATLEVMQRQNIPARAEALGGQMLHKLQNLLRDLPWIAQVRGRGLMLAVELRDPVTAQPAKQLTWSVVTEALQRGLIVLPCGVHGNAIQLTPSALMTEQQLDSMCEILALSIRAVLPAHV